MGRREQQYKKLTLRISALINFATMAVYTLLLLALPCLVSGWVKEMEGDGLYQGDMILNPEQKEAVAAAIREGNAFASIKTDLWDARYPIAYDFSSDIANSQKARYVCLYLDLESYI